MPSKPEQYWSKPRGMLPNSRFPLLVYRGALPGGGVDALRSHLHANGWYNIWRYPGIYEYRHFHSTTHECLGCAAGWMEVEVFGRDGTKLRVQAGDFIVMPAGVSHQMIGHSDDIMMVGGYPDGRDWDNVQEDKIDEQLRRAAAKRIMMLPIPNRDPVTGQPMTEWILAPSSVDADLNDFRDNLDPV
jgi:uncharacterized protein YjlB